MKAKEIIKGMECCTLSVHTKCEECPYYIGDGRCNAGQLQKDALVIIKRQQKLIKDISQMIADNTYPYFNKDGKPVNIWNPDGYRMIEQRLKEMAGDRDK